MKLLVITPEPVDADRLRTTVGPEVEGAEVLVVSPATNQSKLAFWVSDPDDAIAEAKHAETETVENLADEDVHATGDVGESDPAQAIDDPWRRSRPTASSSSPTLRATATTARMSRSRTAGAFPSPTP